MSQSSTTPVPRNLSQQRQALAEAIQTLADRLAEAETVGETTSGKLELAPAIATLNQTAQALRQSQFRVVVLGDMKRGKSTLLNALLGTSILPMDVRPCTAVLTVIRASDTPQVTIHYHAVDRPPTVLDLETFKRDYTIAPDEAQTLANQEQVAFPDVSHAVLDYPLPWLQPGIELIDTPGLNDTEARNQQVFDYLSQAHAVLFVLSATQPCTLAERRYLQNYLRDRGVALFFAVNGRDQLHSSLVDPTDAAAVAAAEANLQTVLQTQLADYCGDRYDERVFWVSALDAYRRRSTDPDADLSGTGLPKLLHALEQFLLHERAQTEFQQAEGVAQRASWQVQEAVARRIPLLAQDTASLRETIAAVQGEFKQLREIRNRFGRLIDQTSAAQAQQIADSFRDYIHSLETTFATDFAASQPELKMGDFLDPKQRSQFQRDFQQAFERYLNDRLTTWELTARQALAAAFTDLNQQGQDYQVAYAQVVDVMNEKLLDRRFYAVGVSDTSAHYSPWSDRLQDFFTAVPDYLNKTTRPFSRFWQQVLQWGLIYACISIVPRIVAILFSSLALNIFGAVALTAGAVAVQAEWVRQDFLKAVQREFAKHLPAIAQEQWQPIYTAVQRCFEDYKATTLGGVDQDIDSRQGELDNLLHQKETTAVHQEQETQRLNALAAAVAADVQSIQNFGEGYSV